jgi:2-octaprenyl-6-methoxyphenol hydroxylase
VRDTAGIATREHRFDQSELVSDLSLGRPIGGTSVEFHYAKGPFTLVPAGGNQANLVWIDDTDGLAAAKASPNVAALFRERSQRLFGSIEVLTSPVVFPLSTLSVETAGRNGVVLVGEAAHAFPPIGAQGLNLGLRDVADLAAALDAPDISAEYARRRSGDLARTGGMVDALFRSLLSNLLPAQMVRAGGLWALKLSPAVRRHAFSLGMGRR